MAYFNTCPTCGCNLDPGEKCDCEEEKTQNIEFIEKHTTANKKTGQYAFVWDMQEAGYGQKAIV